MSTLQSKEIFENDMDVFIKDNETSCFPDFHFHDQYEIYYCIGGGKQYIIEDSIYAIHPGDLFIINNLEIHKPLRDPDGDYRRIVVVFRPEMVQEISRHSIDLLSCFTSRKKGMNNKIILSITQQDQLVAHTQRMHALDENSYGYKPLMEALLIELLVMINQWYQSGNAQPQSDETYGFNPNVRKIINYLNDQFTSDISLDDIADEFHMDKVYMCQLFKKATGTTIHRYLISRRLARAKILLQQGHNVTETSSMCGFRNYSHFIRSFKNHFGKPPLKFVNEHGGTST